MEIEVSSGEVGIESPTQPRTKRKKLKGKKWKTPNLRKKKNNNATKGQIARAFHKNLKGDKNGFYKNWNSNSNFTAKKPQ